MKTLNYLKPSLALYLEDAPVRTVVQATGLSKALVPMLKDISARVSKAYIFQTHSYFRKDEIFSVAKEETYIANRFTYLLSKFISNMPFPIAVKLAKWQGAWAGLKFRGRNSSMFLWGAVGVDPLSMVRLSAFSSAIGADFEIYVVDDIETHPSNSNKRGLKGVISNILRRASRVYTITPELSSLFTRRYNVEACWLPLISECPESNRTFLKNPEYFAVYLGSINHLYREGLCLLIQMISELRHSSREELKVRLISPRKNIELALGGSIPDWVESGVIESQSELAVALTNAKFCFLPYSFEESARSMTESSFPSKLLDYLAWGRKIVVYAPNGSVPYTLFKQIHLPVLTSSISELRAELERILLSNDDLSELYRTSLRTGFGPGKAHSIIFGTPSSKPV